MTSSDTRERTRRSDLLELRKNLDAQKKWRSEVQKQERVLKDPLQAAHHGRAAKLKELATRALALSDQQVETLMSILNAEDDKEEIEKQLATLDY